MDGWMIWTALIPIGSSLTYWHRESVAYCFYIWRVLYIEIIAQIFEIWSLWNSYLKWMIRSFKFKKSTLDQDQSIRVISTSFTLILFPHDHIWRYMFFTYKRLINCIQKQNQIHNKIDFSILSAVVFIRKF